MITERIFEVVGYAHGQVPGLHVQGLAQLDSMRGPRPGLLVGLQDCCRSLFPLSCVRRLHFCSDWLAAASLAVRSPPCAPLQLPTQLPLHALRVEMSRTTPTVPMKYCSPPSPAAHAGRRRSLPANTTSSLTSHQTVLEAAGVVAAQLHSNPEVLPPGAGALKELGAWSGRCTPP